jgi:hypothetical protein
MIPLLLASKSTSIHTTTTLNPADKGSGVTLSNGNLQAVMTLGYGVRATKGYAGGSGKYLFEITINSWETIYGPVIGVATASTGLLNPWTTSGELMFYVSAPQLIWGANLRSSYGAVVNPGDVLGVAVDLVNYQITYYKNGASLGVAYGSNLVLTGTTYFPIVASPNSGSGANSCSVSANFGATSFKYPVSGYSAW